MALRWTFHSFLLFLFTLLRVSLATDCTADAFQSFLPSNASINFIHPISGPNGTFGDLADQDFSANGTNLPSLCAVSIKITVPGNSFSFGLFLPDKWNNRLIGTGNTGFGGGINWPYMGHLVNYGMVAFSTDTGHNSDASDASWAYGADTQMTDWGYLAMHESVVLAKQVITSYYSRKIDYSYYMACSGGGRQGMKEMQDYPEDFNGYAIGAPPWLLSHLHVWATYVGVVNLPNNTDAHISETLLSNITDVITSICDPQDGVSDGTIAEPWSCKFNSSMLLCGSTHTNSSVCLTEAQLPTFDKIAGNWNDEKGNLVFPSMMLGADMSGLGGGDAPSGFGTQYVDNFLYNNTNWDYMTVSPDTVAQADSLDAGSGNADNFDLRPFKAAGGKVMMYHGLADPLIPPASTIYYYEQVQKLMGNTSDFYRLFMIPGMHHCSGSYGAPYYIAGGGQKLDDAVYSVPGYADAQHDIVLAVMNWVENGTAPDSFIATKFKSNLAANGVLKQSPLCAYPQRAIYSGHGNIDQPDNWSCGTGTPLDLPTMTIAEKGSVSISPNPVMQSRPPNSGSTSLEVTWTSHLLVLICSVIILAW